VGALQDARRLRKPVIMIKSGASPSAARARQGPHRRWSADRVFDAVLQECGVIRVTSVKRSSTSR
jgi:acyl-CoA synthetase (NDP forming)